jgi:hypothetical protein
MAYSRFRLLNVKGPSIVLQYVEAPILKMFCPIAFIVWYVFMTNALDTVQGAS